MTPNTITVAFTLNTTNSEAELGFEAWIDDEKFVDIAHVQNEQLVTMTMPDVDGSHELRLVLKGKTQAHTQIDESGNIVSDAILSISNITFDEIKLGHMITDQSVYSHSLNTHFETKMEDRFYGEMGCNGTVSLKFTTPIYLWLLDNM
jgi:hypothetical protein